jgi:hypothetical protein
MTSRIRDLAALFALAGCAFIVRVILFPDINADGSPASALIQELARLRPDGIDDILVPPHEQGQQDFFRLVGEWESAVIWADLAVVLTWYVVVSTLCGVVQWRGGNEPRRLWWAMAVVGLAVSLSPTVLISLEAGGWLLLAGGSLAWLIVVYLGSCLFSPVSHKYAAPLSVALRKAW